MLSLKFLKLLFSIQYFLNIFCVTHLPDILIKSSFITVLYLSITLETKTLSFLSIIDMPVSDKIKFLFLKYFKEPLFKAM